MDRIPFLHQIRARLKSSYSILSDILPSHVVTALLDNSSAEQPPLTEDLPSEPKRPSMVLDRVKGLFSRPSSISGLACLPEHIAAGLISRDDNAPQSPTPSRMMDKATPSDSNSDQQDPLNRNPTRSLVMAENHDCVTVFFSDIVGFSSWAHSLPPAKVMDTLNDLYTRLDDIILDEMPGLYKVETIGDAYIVAANLVERDRHHAATMVRFALRAQQEAAKVPRPDVEDGSPLQMRVGK